MAGEAIVSEGGGLQVSRARGRRAPAPDLARGVMLLVVALAHAPLFTVVDRDPGPADQVAEVLHLLFVNNHARSMFAFLFGYALVQLATHQGATQSWPSVRGLIRRRGWWMIMIGFVHVALLAAIDIVAAYGVVAVLFVGLLRARDATLLRVAAITAVPAVGLAGLVMWFPLSQGVSSYAMGAVAAGDSGAGELLVDRVLGWPAGLVLGVVLVLPGVVLGVWAARRRLLEEPGRHRRLLLRLAVITTVSALLGAVPAILIQTGAWAAPPAAAVWFATFVQPLTGFAGGIGVIGFVALLDRAVGPRPGVVASAVRALGRRSLTFYLAQSVVFVALFYPYGLGLGDRIGLGGASIVAVITWIASLVAAEAMSRHGRRGPAEVLLRRLARIGTR